MAEAIFSDIDAAARDLDIVVCGGHTEITHGLERPLVVGQMLGEMEPDKLIRSSGLRPGHTLILTKGLAIEATALIAREQRDDLSARGYGEELLAKCEAYLETPGISVVADARLATAAGKVTAMHDPTEGGVATGLIELAQASDVGMEIDAGGLFVADESRRLCAEYDLDPLGIISSGALLIGCEFDSAAPILKALNEAGIRADRIGVVREREFGVMLKTPGELQALPVFATDEITRLFVD
jgi:hydrogenase maturation factor